MILISPQGQAARGTRRLIRKLADKGLPVYVFNDCDAWGWYIYWTIKTGSINLAYMGNSIATPEARFLGVTMSDLEKYEFLNKMTMKATEVDLKRAQEMLNYPWINKHKEWVEELKKVHKDEDEARAGHAAGAQAHIRRRLHKGQDKEQGVPAVTIPLSPDGGPRARYLLSVACGLS